MRRLMLLALLSAACGSVSSTFDAGPEDNPDGGTLDEQEFSSGSRLRIQWIAAADGYKQFSAFVDTGLGDTACYFDKIAGTNDFVCVPDGYGIYYFSDPGCTNAVIQVYTGSGSCPQDARYAYRYSGNCNAGGVEELYEIGGTFTPTELFYDDEASGCLSIGAPTPDFTYHSLGAEVPLSELVHAALSDEPATATRVTHDYLVADDGARQPWNVKDTTLDVECDFQSADGITNHCVPQSYDASYFSDAGCTTPIAQQYSYSCESSFATQWRWTAIDECTGVSELTVFELGEAVAATEIYYDSGTECYPTGVDPAVTYYDVGAEVTDLVTGERVVAETNGRLRPYVLETPDGYLSRTYEVRDTEGDTDCNFRYTEGGTIHCLPRGLDYAQRVFTDAACTVETFAVSHYTGACANPLPTLALIQDQETCPNAYGVANVGAQLTATLYSLAGDGTCAEYYTSSDQTWYAVGATVPLTSFGEVSLVVE